MKRRAFTLGLAALTLLWALSAFVAVQPGAAEDPHGAEATSEEVHGAAGDAADAHAADAHAADADHGEHDEHEGAHFHMPSFLDLIIKSIPGGQESTVGHALFMFAPTIFGILVAIFVAVVVQAATRNLTLIPGKLQNLLELVIGGLNDFIIGILGPEGRRFVPFLGTLFVYIWTMNMIGLVPLMFAPTSRIHMTAALAIPVFAYVQYTSMRMNGIGGWLLHLAGDPKDLTGWLMAPLMFPLHIISELAKPFSLAVRLFANVFGEETLIAVFATLGVMVVAFLPIPIGIPFQVPFLLLSILMGTIQAMVFMLLSTIYFALAMPHGHDEH